MTTHLIKPGRFIGDMQMRCGLPAIKAGRCDMLGTENGLDQIDCAGCLRDLIIDMRCEALGPAADSPEGRWIAGGDTGTSSITIWSVMMGCSMPRDRSDRGRAPSVPHDPSDFGRCHRLLELFPAWRSRLPEVAAKYPAWGGLVGAWAELTALYIEELPSGRCPRLWERMEELEGQHV
jgi:hypothetical protein